MLRIDESSVGPQLSGDFLSSQQFAGPLQKHDQHLEGLRVQLDADSLPAKLARDSVCFKCSEAIAPGWHGVRHVSCRVYPIALSILDFPQGTTSRKSNGCNRLEVRINLFNETPCIACKPEEGKVQCMTRRLFSDSRNCPCSADF